MYVGRWFLFACLWCLALVPGMAQDFDPTISHMIVNEEEFTRDFYVADRSETAFVPADRDYHWYRANRVLVTKGGQGGRLLHGDYREYFLNKNLKAFGSFRRGLKVGEWREWYENGMIRSISHFRAGKKRGRQFNYDVQGVLTQVMRFRDGQRNGWTRIFEDNRCVRKEKYRNGTLVKSRTFGTAEAVVTEEPETATSEEKIEPAEERRRLRKLIRRLKRNNKEERPAEEIPTPDEE